MPGNPGHPDADMGGRHPPVQGWLGVWWRFGRVYWTSTFNLAGAPETSRR
ncbi:hypothetical protein [uncultured Thiodictyon sp.]|nr:hypothetical protein [uncultured Thiodictyon sp.]